MSFESHVLGTFDTRTGPGDEVRLCCPFCDDTSFHGYANVVKRVFHCFRCNRGMSALEFLTSQGYSHRMALLILFEKTGSFIPVVPCETNSDFALRVDSLLEWAEFEQDRGGHSLCSCLPEGFVLLHPPGNPETRKPGIVLRKAQKYVSSRLRKFFVSDSEYEAEIRRRQIGICVSGEHMGRLVLPVLSKGELLGFQSRAFFPSPNAEPRYLGGSGATMPLALETKTPVLTEGYFDSIAVGPHGVACFHAGLSEFQFRILSSLSFSKKFKVTVFFDGDEAGMRGTVKVCDRLSGAFGRDGVFFVSGHSDDPASMTGEEILAFLKGAKPWSFSNRVSFLLELRFAQKNAARKKAVGME